MVGSLRLVWPRTVVDPESRRVSRTIVVCRTEGHQVESVRSKPGPSCTVIVFNCPLPLCSEYVFYGGIVMYSFIFIYTSTGTRCPEREDSMYVFKSSFTLGKYVCSSVPPFFESEERVIPENV